jgi:hypothetical protein
MVLAAEPALMARALATTCVLIFIIMVVFYHAATHGALGY